MKLTPTRPVTLKTPDGPRTYSPGEVFEAPPEKAKKFIEKGFLRPVDQDGQPNFEALEMELWPKLGHCHWGGLTPEEQGIWGIAIRIQARCKEESNLETWKGMSSVLLSIAEKVNKRLESKKPVQETLGLDEGSQS